jgi:RimJ/RimL family protein N-acetyltransferase
MRIDTGRLILHPLTPEDLKTAAKDLAAVARAYGAALPYIGFWEMWAKRRIYKAKRDLISQNPATWLLSTSWLIIDRAALTVVGEAGFKGPPSRGAVEIGYGVLEGFRNKGYMTEAVGALTRMAFIIKNCRVERVIGLTLPENIASHRVLEKNQFTRQPSLGKYWTWERRRLAEEVMNKM